jgi:fatty acid desaturase
MRALENIVHFGSHHNLTSNKAINDYIINLIAAWPLMQNIKQYRIFHTVHHGHFGADNDPCRIRLKSIGINLINLNSTFDVLKAIFLNFPKYIKEYYKEVASNKRQLFITAIWHLLICTILVVLVSLKFAIFYFFTWFIIMFTILPLIRSIAELSEHDYEKGESITETTYNNLKLWDHLLFHPAGDAYHILHHLYPSISWWNQKSAHRFLMLHDPAYQCLLHRNNNFD